jgi:hypothetical protein
MKYFRCLLRELGGAKGMLAHLYNIPEKQIRQSSVSIIFRVNKPESFFEQFREEI